MSDISTGSGVAESDARVTGYATAVLAGDIVAGPYVRNACQRYLDDREYGADRGLEWRPEEVHRVFQFFEKVLRLSDGQFEGKPFVLQPAQAFILGNIFGWYRERNKRRFTRAFIEMGKGNGKSPLAGGIGLYGLIADREHGAQIYAVAAKRDQADILFRDAIRMRDQAPLIRRMTRTSGGPGKEFNLACNELGSFFRPLSRDTGRTGSGPRPYFVLADEIHEMPDRAILEILEAGFKARESPLLFMITNSGSDRNSVAWEEHTHAVICASGNREAVNDPTYLGEVIDDRTFAYVCALDKDDDPLEDPDCWVKANPLLDVIIDREYIAGVVKQARDMPSRLNTILRLNFCIWTDADQAWMERELLEKVLTKINPQDYAGRRVYLGLDLSQVRDLTALAATTITGKTEDGKNKYATWVEAWTPGDTIKSRELRDKVPYIAWRDEGWLHAPKGVSINYTMVAQRIQQINTEHNIGLIAYDRYAIKRVEEYLDENCPGMPFAEHPQGGVRRGKPLIENDRYSGLWFPGSLREFEEAILENRIQLQANPVLISAILSSVVGTDLYGNKWLAKERSTYKIDAAVAAVMSVGAALAMGADEGKKKKEVRFIAL